MESYLMVLEQQNPCPNYQNFLGHVESDAKKHEGIEQLSRNVYMIPEKMFLQFVSEVGVRMVASRPMSNQTAPTYKYKCLPVEEDAQWLHFVGFPQL